MKNTTLTSALIPTLTSTLIIFTLMFVFFTAHAPDAAALPQSILAIQEENAQAAQNVLLHVSIIIAFLAGALTILSPCVLPLLPAFFAYTFKEKQQITKMTLIFFLGFAATFVTLGLITAFIGDASIIVLQEKAQLLVKTAGALLIALGAATIFGYGFSGINIPSKRANDPLGMFVYGLLFAIGWTACVGPILAGILIMTTLYHNYFIAILLMFFYALGIFTPLFILAYFYDAKHLEKNRWIQGKMMMYTLFGKEKELHTTTLISGMLLIITGSIFIIFEGTAIVNGIDPFGTKKYFYDIQRILLEGKGWFTVVGIVFLCILGFLVYTMIKKKDSEEKRQ